MRSTVCLMIVAGALTGVADDSTDTTPARNSPRKAEAALSICIEADPSQPQKLALKVVITNNSASEIKLEEDLSNFFTWEVVDGCGSPVEPQTIPSDKDPPRAKLVSLCPNERLCRTVQLGESGIVTTNYAREATTAPDGGLRIVPHAWKSRVRYTWPPNVSEIRVTLRYDTTDADMADAFSLVNRERPEKSGIYLGMATSNQCCFRK